MMNRSLFVSVLVCGLFAATTVYAQSRQGEDTNVRTVQGTVTNPEDGAVEGAVVQLKNTKTLQIRSFITKEHGAYYFHGLSPNVDYELKAEHQGLSSSSKTLSAFDSRRQAVINLKLEKK
jgi:hypothetical protein